MSIKLARRTLLGANYIEPVVTPSDPPVLADNSLVWWAGDYPLETQLNTWPAHTGDAELAQIYTPAYAGERDLEIVNMSSGRSATYYDPFNYYIEMYDVLPIEFSSLEEGSALLVLDLFEFNNRFALSFSPNTSYWSGLGIEIAVVFDDSFEFDRRIYVNNGFNIIGQHTFSTTKFNSNRYLVIEFGFDGTENFVKLQVAESARSTVTLTPSSGTPGWIGSITDPNLLMMMERSNSSYPAVAYFGIYDKILDDDDYTLFKNWLNETYELGLL